MTNAAGARGIGHTYETADLKALEITQMQVLARQARSSGADAPNPASSILKIRGSQLQQAATELMMEIAGPEV